MGDLIDRSMLFEEMRKFKKKTYVEGKEIPNWNDAVSLIGDAPCAVVHCRDCGNYSEEPFGDVKMCYKGLGYTHETDFCSFGMRVGWRG